MTRWTALTAVLVLLGGCATSGPAGLGPGEGALDAGPTEWVLVEGSPIVDGYPITLRIEGDRVGGSAACNSYSGNLIIAGARFEVGVITRTEMGCPAPGVHDSESAYLEALQAVERYERTAGELMLQGTDVELRFEAVPPEEDAELTGTEWGLSSLATGTGPEGVVSSTMGEAMLRLADDAAFTATDGCNEMTGRWALEGDVLRLSDVVSTDVACPALDQQVAHIHRVLLADPSVMLEGRRLLLTAGSDALEYRAP